MPFALTVVAVAVALGYLLGGRLRNIGETGMVANALLFAGLALQVVVDVLAGRALLVGWSVIGLLLLSQVIVGAWIVANLGRPGMRLILAGLVLNAVVMLANGAMPVSAHALAATGLEEPGELTGKHELMTGATRLGFLADVIPLPPLRSVISIGDVVLGLGLARLVPHLMGAATRREPGAQHVEPVA